MRLPTSLLPAAAAILFLGSCAGPADPVIENMPATPTLTDAAPVPAASGESKRFVIRDKQQRLRVDGRVNAGRMDGMWIYYDSKGEKLAIVNYRLDQRQGPVQLYYVTADGPAVGRVRMLGNYDRGSAQGMITSRWASGGKKLERDFDHGMIQGARGWTEKNTRMSDGEAMKAAIDESRAEDALLTELENFVQLQLRAQGTKSQDSVPDLDLELPRINPAAGLPYPGGTPPLSKP